MRTNLFVLILFFIITFPAYSALLHPGMLTSHDGEGHIIRMFEFNRAIEDGHFPVRWSKRLNWGLGYPYFNFNYPLTYYLTYLLNKAGLDLLSGFKAILLLSFPLSAFFVFLWLKQHFARIPSFAGGLFYSLIPYHFVNVYVRGNIAETLSLTIVPLGFFLVSKLHQKPGLKRVILLSLCLSSIILSHNITALLFLPILFIYSLLLGLNKTYLKHIFYAFISPVFLTSFFWFPILLTKQFIIIDKTFPLYYLKNFSDFKDIIYSVWGYGGSKTGPGQMSVQIGLLHLLVLLISMFLAFKVRAQRKTVLFFLGLSTLTIFMMLSLSKPVWDVLVPLQYIQFPWRLLSVIALTTAFLAAFTLSLFPKNKIMIIVLFCILALLFFNRNHWRANQYYNLPNYWFLDETVNSTTTVDGEHTPKWQTENRPSETARFEIISGQADARSVAWKTNYHAFDVNSKSESQILDRTVYFPGWTVFIDGNQVANINQNNPKVKGLIGFEVPGGKHLVEVKLLEPFLYKITNNVSLISLLFAVVILIIPKKGCLR